ncbi:glycerol kinase GlpK [Trichlorobacter ammonificans]|uniref:Glycerol kinase n=1 Tax=Trichlorobacter ammonificans TaxID=2916410 RepID=A0ABN8HHA6_9BACT|nr:glycerol kinase GlpK [Trichlorobacter ammonificans]CAH2030514.1 glycerol kinase [Trichlorobacter ammonificans]
MSYILAMDQGTTSSRAIIFDHAAEIKGTAQREFRQIYPQPGWVEHDPLELYSSQLEVAHEALERAGLTAADLAAIGIANQRETTLVWERQNGEPIHNAIVWQDRRTADTCRKLQADGLEPLFRERTGLLLDPYFSGTKLAWILDHVPDARKRAETGELLFGTVDSWLLWKLTGGTCHFTDPSNASRTLLFNLATGDWDPELLRILNIPAAILPRLARTSEVYGETAPGLFSRPVPIASLAGDQQAALFGQGCLVPGMSKNTYGTGCFMLMHTGQSPTVSDNRLLTTVAWQISDRIEYALEGSVFVSGAVIQWLRDGLGIIRSSDEVEALAASVADNGGVYLVPAFAGLGAPHWDPFARGAIIGISRGTTAAHLARAALESIAFQTTELVRAMESDTGIPLPELRVDGGATVNNLLLQIQADLLGVPVVRTRISDTTALGAAFLAGLAVDFWRDRNDLPTTRLRERIFVPTLMPERRAMMLRNWERALQRATKWEEPLECS